MTVANRLARGAVLGVSIVLVAVGCGFSGGEMSNDPNTVELLAPSYRDGENGTKALWDGIIADFEKQNPQFKVDLQMQSWTSINDVVRTDLQNQQTTPDILNLDAYASFARDGLLYRARDVLSDAVMRDFQPAFAANASLDGTQYGMPLFASTRTLFYNKDLFARAGVSAPPKTWDELFAAAKKISALGVPGYGLPLGAEESQAETSIWTFGAGGRWSSAAGGQSGSAGRITVDTPQNVTGVAQMRRFIDAGVTQPNAGATDRKDVINAFIQGRIGMIEGLPPTLDMIATQNPALRYGTAPSPTESGSPVTLGVADHLMAFVKNGKRRRAIEAFLDYFYSPPVYANFVKTEGFIPITLSGARALADTPVTRAFGPTLPYAQFYPSGNPKWVAVQAAIQQNIGTVAQGADPQTVLARIQRVADEGS